MILYLDIGHSLFNIGYSAALRNRITNAQHSISNNQVKT